jgi:hypothetical protein
MTWTTVAADLVLFAFVYVCLDTRHMRYCTARHRQDARCKAGVTVDAIAAMPFLV